MPAEAFVPLLIIEDDLQTLECYCNVFARFFPATVLHTACNSVEALFLFNKFRHDIIVSDVRLPNKDDGLKIACDVYHTKPDTFIFLVTADSLDMGNDFKSNIQYSCIKEIFKKPIDVRALCRKIKETIEIIANQAPVTI